MDSGETVGPVIVAMATPPGQVYKTIENVNQLGKRSRPSVEVLRRRAGQPAAGAPRPAAPRQLFSLRKVEVPHQIASANSSTDQTEPHTRPEEPKSPPKALRTAST